VEDDGGQTQESCDKAVIRVSAVTLCARMVASIRWTADQRLL